ncbi:hypothetical protein MFLAVUS_004085 [Mucor flavus]|uniref:Ubiquitin thioesterase OTU n=1 Tax=Mucor flavus TaxID=439312 RepID=A0ABP9YUX1_9FUNG
MRLRVRHAGGQVTLSDPTPETTVLELKQYISKALELQLTQGVEISGGYPPKPITNDTLTLQHAGLKDGDTLNARALDNVNTVPKQTTLKTIRDGVVEMPTGFLTLRIMDDDNSCLFRSIGNLYLYILSLVYVLERDTTISSDLRKVIANKIRADPLTYSDATLGQPRDKYIDWIQKPTAWGGAIELAIFSSHFSIEIDSIDVQTGRIDKFGEGKYEERVLIVYSGIHYDALALAPTVDSPMEFDQTRFSVADNYVLDASKELIDGLRKKHKYTDVANFTLKCEQCNTGLKGEKDAQEHAAATGHTHFTEYQ